MLESLAPFGQTTVNAATRLTNTTNSRERIVAQVFARWNTPGETGAVPVVAILEPRHGQIYSKDEIAIMSATIQWLGTHCGAGFLAEIIETAEQAGAPFHELKSW